MFKLVKVLKNVLKCFRRRSDALHSMTLCIVWFLHYAFFIYIFYRSLAVFRVTVLFCLLLCLVDVWLQWGVRCWRGAACSLSGPSPPTSPPSSFPAFSPPSTRLLATRLPSVSSSPSPRQYGTRDLTLSLLVLRPLSVLAQVGRFPHNLNLPPLPVFR